jgi:hypothetical protein
MRSWISRDEIVGGGGDGRGDLAGHCFRTEIRALKSLPFCRAIHTCEKPVLKTIGYARVTTRDQDLTGQIDALRAAVPREDQQRARIGRSSLSLPGDVVLVTKLDRLGRSTRELLELIERIGQAGAFFKSLGNPLFDTTTPTGRLLSTLLAAIRRV